ncbi:glycoside hydrolase [Occultella gossypii]|uniref:BNR repeat-like domain-containing protein n=1 Tax=Occultella gossypii TaxID=2800820 RepID=A0ABS7S3D1_9MICO|nr:glycoside hydrolase [Occultella gossypii]MBZ2194854.1 hypothetical protein [Occultella gossypii]
MSKTHDVSRRQLLGGAVVAATAATFAGSAAGAWADPDAAAPTDRPEPGGQASLEFDRHRYVQLEADFLGTDVATYPRIRTMSDGRYLLTYQDAKIGWNILWTTSTDLADWSAPQLLFASHPILDGTDDQCYSTVDTVVLANGDVLAVCSFRANHLFYHDMTVDGLMLRRSTDHGITWGSEEVIYVGANWEPYIGQLSSGEVQIYFSHTAPKIAVEATRHCSGVAIIRSFDDGATWTPDVRSHPFAADRVAQQYTHTNADGVKMITDQMPSALQTGPHGQIALAMESRQESGAYMISFAYTQDNWPDALDMDETGPTDRADNVWLGAAPYLAQFPTGETVVAYNVNSRQMLRLGDREARTFGDAVSFLPGTGYWGMVNVTGPQTLLASMAYARPTGNALMIGTLHLNRTLAAERIASAGHGGGHLWPSSENDLLIGSDGPSQVRIRAGRDAGRMLLRVERNGDAGGRSEVFIASRRRPDVRYRLALGTAGLDGLARFIGGGYVSVSSRSVGCTALVIDGTGSAAWELDFSASLLSGAMDEYAIAGLLYTDGEPGGEPVVDSNIGVEIDDPASWFTVTTSR